MSRVSVVVPTLNEACALAATLERLCAMADVREVIVADGGSTDATARIAEEGGARLVRGEPGRGTQLHAGARAASGEVLWFLHADTLPPTEGARRIVDALADERVAGGSFEVRFSGNSTAARFFTVAYPVVRRCGLRYGDSGLFVRRTVYEELGGFPPYPLFEDLEFARRLARASRLVCIAEPVVTSSRRFEGRSAAALVGRWVWLHLLYGAGMPPERLARFYRPMRE